MLFLRIKGRICEIYILLIHFFFGQPQPFAKALEVDDLSGPEKLDDVIHIRVIRKPQNIVVGNPGLLLCCNCAKATFTMMHF